ncbi:hypothetical protein Hanom_Chr17g01554801 [Helianthus anomalus]
MVQHLLVQSLLPIQTSYWFSTCQTAPRKSYIAYALVKNHLDAQILTRLHLPYLCTISLPVQVVPKNLGFKLIFGCCMYSFPKRG